MSDTVLQKMRDSEEGYLNTSFWSVRPLFDLVKQGKTEELGAQLHPQLDSFPAGRITRDARKQLEYLAVSLVNTFMIAAIEGSVYPPDANAIADVALGRLSHIHAVSEIPTIIREAAARLCELVRETKNKDTGNVHVERAKQYLSANLTREISTDDIAKAVQLSPYHLSRLFKAHTGQTMREYLLSQRIEIAKQLLRSTDDSITQIAALLRFCDQSYFTKVFRQQTGQTPQQYRNHPSE